MRPIDRILAVVSRDPNAVRRDDDWVYRENGHNRDKQVYEAHDLGLLDLLHDGTLRLTEKGRARVNQAAPPRGTTNTTFQAAEAVR